jgi:DNA-binding MarR family transcriptional regulator
MQLKGSTGEGTLLLDVWFVMNLTGRLLDDALRAVGITADEFGLYSLIYSFGPLTQSQIARWTGMPLTTISGTIRRLSARGHLHEMPNPDDARSRTVELTDDGIEATFAGAQILAEILPRLSLTLQVGEEAVRATLHDLDQGLRQLVGSSPRPYAASEAAKPRGISYPGAPLTPAQNAEVRRYIDWIRVRDAPAP